MEQVEIKINIVEVVLNELRAEGLIDETAYRNFKIRQHHKILVDTGMHNNKAIEFLSDRYCLGDKCIQKIIYNLDGVK